MRGRSCCPDRRGSATRCHRASEAMAEAGVCQYSASRRRSAICTCRGPGGSPRQTIWTGTPGWRWVSLAPGREMVKDKQIHVAVGVVEYYQLPDGGWAVVSSSAINVPRVFCRRCLTLVQDPPEAGSCITCGASEPEYSILTLSEPTGYRSSFWPRDYEQLEDSYSWASAPRLALDRADEHPPVLNAVVRSAKAQAVSVVTATAADRSPLLGRSRHGPRLLRPGWSGRRPLLVR